MIPHEFSLGHWAWSNKYPVTVTVTVTVVWCMTHAEYLEARPQAERRSIVTVASIPLSDYFDLLQQDNHA
jgi:hypothetical protein